MPDDGGATTLPDDLDLQTLSSQQVRDGLCAGFNVCLVESCQRHTRNSGERFEVLTQRRQKVSDPGLQGAQSGRVKIWGQNVTGHDCERTHFCTGGSPGWAIGGKATTRHTVVLCLDAKKPVMTAPRRL